MSTKSNYLQWLPLVIGDRFSLVKGLGRDFLRSFVPDGTGESGRKSRKALRKTIIRVGIAAGVAALIVRRINKNK